MGFFIMHSVPANLYFLSCGTKETFSYFVFRELKMYQLTSQFRMRLCRFVYCYWMNYKREKERKKENTKKKGKAWREVIIAKRSKAPMGAFYFYLETLVVGEATKLLLLLDLFFFFFFP